MCCEFLRPADVFILSCLVATAEQHDHDTAAINVVDPVPGPIIDLQLDDAIANAARLTRITVFQTIDSGENSRLCLTIAQIFQPVSEGLRYANLN